LTAETTSSSSNRQIARAAGTVMVAMIASNLAGLAAKMLTANAFGTGAESQAFYAANRFPDILFNLVAGGALGSAFIPTFTTFLTRDERSQAWKLASAVSNLVTIILVGLCLISAIFARQIVEYILVPGFTDPELLTLTANLMRVMLISPVIFGLSGLVMGILNAHQVFLYPALAPAMYQVGWILGIVVLAPHLGIFGLAWGTVLGALLHLLVQVPMLLRLPGQSYSLSLGKNFPAVGEVARLMGPRLFGVAVVQLNFLVNTNLASGMPDGSLSGINYAFPLMIMPEAAIAQSIAIAALPTFSAQVARGRPEDMRSSLAASLRGVLLLAIPATLGLILLRVPLVSLVYERGSFTPESTRLVAWALLWYAAGLVGHSIVEIVSRAFYALHDTRTPVSVGVAAMGLNLAFSLGFSALFPRIGWAPLGGLALANSLATFIEAGTLLFLMRRRLGGLEGKQILTVVLSAGAASLAMAAALWGWSSWLNGRSAALVTLGGVGIGGLVYLLGLVLLRVNEVSLLIHALIRRFIPQKGEVK
jgi:putative peptidoglycan lipid II flippase